jgi:hypothetical protein
VLLERHYQPVADTPMSRVRDDCQAALDGRPEGAIVWKRWHEAVAAAKDADISFRLTSR